MSETKLDMKELAEIMKAAQGGSTVMDSVFKVLTGISTAGILGSIAFAFGISNSVARIETNQTNYNSNMAEVRTFMKEPRFTESMFISKLTPIADRLVKVEEELNYRRELIVGNQSEVKRNARDIEQIHEDLDDMAEDIKEIKSVVTGGSNNGK